ncbi:restriction endonuclease subunit S [Planktothrix mougeotii LEGE 06226]|uniref:Restriction endonuclease subunit S n=2 Tax=Planktothrix mougeotii TaxID=54306 RepID=A0ABR9UIY3_9CYAN|nr:restriction endonuclease subunit S [Planktothrix mougeotii LEGE 06226]
MMGKYNAYEKYKDSGVEWLGEIPEHWQSLKIKRLTLIKRGASPRPIDDPKYFDDDGEYAWVRIADVTASERYLETTTQSLSELGKSLSVPLEPGNLFLSIAGSVGKPIITKIKCCIHDGFVYFPDLKANQEFIYYIFNSGQPYLGLGKLGTQLNLNSETVGGITIGLPPLPEQQAIANFLDYKTQQIDALINKKESLLEKLDEKRTAIISHAVTKGLDSNVPMKDSGIEWLGEIPEHWESLKIKRLTLIKRGASPRPIDDPKYFDDDGEYAWVRIADVTASERYLETTTQKLSELGKSLSVPLEPGNLFLSIAGSVGKPIITKIKCCIHDGFVYFPHLRANQEFIYYIFNSGQPYLGLGKMGTQLNLNTETVGGITIGLPPLPEQQTIANFLDQKTTKIDQQKAKIQQAIDLLKEYRTALITNAVTGKIDVRQVPIP